MTSPLSRIRRALSPVAATLAGLALLVAPSASHAANPVTPGNFTGFGFDQCLAPTQSAMDAWWEHSPFTAVGIYISGDSRACRKQPNLTPEWISTQLATGWRLLPIALGPQAACLDRFPRYADDFKISARRDRDGGYSTARSQGTVEATKNVNDAMALGITTGSTIWYDLEAFPMASTTAGVNCSESALSFIDGWVTQVKAMGYAAGFYSSSGSGIKLIDDARRLRPGRFALPDQIWIARWDGVPNTSAAGLPEDGWRPGGRMKQYRGGHYETHGGVRINIDSNWLDLGRGSVARPEGWCRKLPLTPSRYRLLTPERNDPALMKVVQCHLRRQGFWTGRLTGGFGKKSQHSIAAWQRANRLPVGARVAQRHWVALLARGMYAGSAVKTATTPVLKRGSAGPEVYRLQRTLMAAGFAPAAVSGVFDETTQTRLSELQKAWGLPVTGTTGGATWVKLFNGRR